MTAFALLADIDNSMSSHVIRVTLSDEERARQIDAAEAILRPIEAIDGGVGSLAQWLTRAGAPFLGIPPDFPPTLNTSGPSSLCDAAISGRGQDLVHNQATLPEMLR